VTVSAPAADDDRWVAMTKEQIVELARADV